MVHYRYVQRKVGKHRFKLSPFYGIQHIDIPSHALKHSLYRMHSTSLDLLAFLVITTSLKNKVPVDISYSGEKSKSGGHLRETTKEFF